MKKLKDRDLRDIYFYLKKINKIKKKAINIKNILCYPLLKTWYFLIMCKLSKSFIVEPFITYNDSQVFFED